MIDARWLCSAACSLIAFSASMTWAGRTATDEILRILPADIAACAIVQDLANLVDSSSDSPLVARIEKTPVVQRWKESPEYKAFEQFLTFTPIYFGVSNEQLVKELFGKSVVLAFRPEKDGRSGLGLLACRASNEDVLTKIVERLVSPSPSRVVNRLEHLGIAYHERRELGRRDFLLRVGPILVVAGDSRAIESVIQLVQGKGRSLATDSRFEKILVSAPKDAHVQVLLQTDAFDSQVSSAAERAEDLARPFARLVAHAWSECEWFSVSLKIDDPCELELRASVKMESLTTIERRWLTHIASPSSIVDRMPVDVLAFMVSPVDFPSLGQAVHEIGGNVAELRPLLDAVEQLPIGLSLKDDLLGNLGPDLAVIIRPNESGESEIIVETKLQDVDVKSSVGLSLPQTFELTLLRPLLVFFAVDHNNVTGEESQVETIVASGRRLHVLRGATKLPFQMEPSFLVDSDRILVGTSPDALTRWMASSPARWADGRQARKYQSVARKDEVLKGFVDVSQLSRGMASPPKGFAEEISARSGVDEKKLSGEINDLAAILSLVDFASLSTSTEGDVRVWTVRVFPSENPDR